MNSISPHARATRNHFHIALFGIFLPLVSLPPIAVIAVIDWVRAKDSDARFWARMLLGLTALDAAFALVLLAVSAQRITPESIGVAEGDGPPPVAMIVAGVLALGVSLALACTTRGRAGALRFWVWFGGLLATGMLVVPTATLFSAEKFGVPRQAATLVALAAQMGALLVLGILAIRATRPVDPAEESSHLTPLAGWAMGCFYMVTLLPRVGLVMVGVLFLTGMHAPAPLSILEVADNSPLLSVLLAAVVVVIGPIAEEVTMRGLLLPWLRTSLGTTGALVGSAAVFGLLHAHYGPMVMVPFLHGLIFGWARIATGGLLAPILLHATVNGVVLSISLATELVP